MVVAKVLDIPSTGDCVGVGCSDQGPKGKILLKQLLNFLVTSQCVDIRTIGQV